MTILPCCDAFVINLNKHFWVEFQSLHKRNTMSAYGNRTLNTCGVCWSRAIIDDWFVRNKFQSSILETSLNYQPSPITFLNKTLGHFCEEQVNDCIENACQNGGTCIDGNKNYSCSCRNGFTWDYITYLLVCDWQCDQIGQFIGIWASF